MLSRYWRAIRQSALSRLPQYVECEIGTCWQNVRDRQVAHAAEVRPWCGWHTGCSGHSPSCEPWYCSLWKVHWDLHSVFSCVWPGMCSARLLRTWGSSPVTPPPGEHLPRCPPKNQRMNYSRTPPYDCCALASAFRRQRGGPEPLNAALPDKNRPREAAATPAATPHSKGQAQRSTLPA